MRFEGSQSYGLTEDLTLAVDERLVFMTRAKGG